MTKFEKIWNEIVFLCFVFSLSPQSVALWEVMLTEGYQPSKEEFELMLQWSLKNVRCYCFFRCHAYFFFQRFCSSFLNNFNTLFNNNRKNFIRCDMHRWCVVCGSKWKSDLRRNRTNTRIISPSLLPDHTSCFKVQSISSKKWRVQVFVSSMNSKWILVF